MGSTVSPSPGTTEVLRYGNTPAAGDPAPSIDYRRDIQVLRGLAVLAVLLYHADFGAPGGFMGVDVFFVISGYLITLLLTREVESTGRVDVGRFWARRVRRLLPAASLVALTVAAWAWLALPRIDLPKIGGSIIASGLYVANLYFARADGGYFGHDALEPMLHYWSLSVEEQFYVVFPLIVAGIAFRSRIRSEGFTLRRQLLVGFVLILAVSAVLMVLALRMGEESSAFYWMLMRAWQFAVGAALATWRPNVDGAGGRWLAVLGLGAFAVAILAYPTAQPYPGPYAILPTGAAAAMLLGGRALATRVPGKDLRALEHTGAISYSLYLWHWPLLTAIAYHTSNAWPWRAAGLVVAFALAVATTAFVENPVRRLASFRGRPMAVAVLTSSMAALALAGLALNHVLTPADQRLVAVRDERPEVYSDPRGCTTFLSTRPARRCSFPSPTKSSGSLLLLGDSHAMQWFEPVRTVAHERGIDVDVVSRSACPLVDGVTVLAGPQQSLHHGCAEEIDRIAETVSAWGGDVLVVSQSSIYTFMPEESRELQTSWASRAAWNQGFARVLNAIAGATDAKLVFLQDTPRPPADIPACLSVPGNTRGDCAFPPPAIPLMDAKIAALAGWKIVDPTSWYCDAHECPAVREGVVLYRDESHLSVAGANEAVPQLRSALAPVLDQAPPRVGQR